MAISYLLNCEQELIECALYPPARIWVIWDKGREKDMGLLYCGQPIHMKGIYAGAIGAYISDYSEGLIWASVNDGGDWWETILEPEEWEPMADDSALYEGYLGKWLFDD
jgi:hypothetical protein